MIRTRRGALQVESLEGKVLLTTAHPAAARAAAALVAPQAFSLAGTLKMPAASVVTFTLGSQNMGSFKLSGKVGTMGQVNGKFVAVLDGNNNMTAGVLVLSNRKGSVTMSMSTDAADQTAYDYKVTAGTGAFAAASGSGKLATSGVAVGGRVMNFTMTPA